MVLLINGQRNETILMHISISLMNEPCGVDQEIDLGRARTFIKQQSTEH